MKKQVSAIIPAYNESERIGKTLSALGKTKILKEIVVVDDGSKDNTEEVVRDMMKKFPRIKYFRNAVNKGKAYSMDKGVRATSSDIIFFSDADLQGLTPKIIESIINPVMSNKYDMFIGVRNNIMQKGFTPFALNSGERALKREIWSKLPKYYKHRYRVEVGLNYFVKWYGKGYSYDYFSHYQILKERKYGILRGTFFRWWMNFDVSMAFLRMNLVDRFILK
ncbi:glycosyltransferase family 2 protein [Candidatus Pacearchaeota archaeon]|nr:glycosyltransferase family 2 protein [Candidatus Pacearchaeota archaeon]